MSRFAIAMMAALLTPLAASAQSIVGAWKQVETETVGGPNAGTTDTSASNTIWIFSNSYFSLNAALAPLSERAGAADPSAGYVAFAGTYERDGNSLTLHLLNSLSVTQEPTMQREIMVSPTTLETRATAADGVVTIRRYERLE
jgi:hypothetical protein